MTTHFTQEQAEAANDAAIERFFTAAGSAPPTDEQKWAVGRLRDTVVELGSLIELLVPDGRNKALALTHLEDVQMRANRGIFAPTEGAAR